MLTGDRDDVRVSPRSSGPLRCAVCHGEATAAVECPACSTVVHAECRGDACPTLGCAHALVASPPPVAPRAGVRWGRLLALAAVVITVGGIILAAARAARFDPGGRARHPMHAHMMAIGLASRMFESDLGRLPKTLDELLLPPADEPHWQGPYLPDLRDSWGQPYVATFRGLDLEFTLVSTGPDEQPGGLDDLSVQYPEDRQPR